MSRGELQCRNIPVKMKNAFLSATELQHISHQFSSVFERQTKNCLLRKCLMVSIFIKKIVRREISIIKDSYIS